jgi:nicotinate-nucleotide pyrophosphorylase (carboxylating)
MVSSKPDRTARHADGNSQRIELDRIIAKALEEDLGEREIDVTTQNVVDAGITGEARVVARTSGVLSGGDVAARVFGMIRPPCSYEALIPDGTRIDSGDEVARITGPLGSILTGERTALNFLQHMSGIATLTRRYVDALAPFPNVILLDTRKTTPGLRSLERAAVRAGGGHNHRDGLWDAILIKDNHVAAAGGVATAVRRARKAQMPVEVEVDTLSQLAEALAAGAEVVLLDNMSPEEVKQAVELLDGAVPVEVSGRVTLATVGAYAEAGADFISVGAITHSAPVLDLALDLA